MKKEKFLIEGMSCAACSAHIAKAVNSIEGVYTCQVNLLANNMEVNYDEKVCNNAMIMQAVTNAGYYAYQNKTENKPIEKNHKLRDLVIAFSFLIVLMYFSMGSMLGLPLPKAFSHHNSLLLLFTELLLTLPILYLYRNYFISGFKKLIKGHPNMDSLIAIGSASAFLYGIIVIYILGYAAITNNYDLASRYHHIMYFESAGMILTLVSLGKYFEAKSKKKTTNAISHLVNLAPKMAYRLVAGKEELVKADDLHVNDIVIVRKGDIIAIDGIILEGNATILEANITGEAMPKAKKCGDTVYASTQIMSGYIKVLATKVSKDTSFATIIRLVEEASNSKAPISKLADKVSGFFVPAIMLIALLTFILNLVFARGFELSFNFAISVLVIACPCALGLATPVAIMVGCGKGASLGLIIKNADVLEKAQYIKTVVFDKTGTITEGKPTINYLKLYTSDAFNIAYSLEAMSEHPLALAIIDYAEKNNVNKYVVDEYKALDGKGLEGIIKGEKYYIGNELLINELGIDLKPYNDLLIELYQNGNTVLIVAAKSKIIAILGIKDKIKSSAKEAIKALASKNIKSVMLTGDNKYAAEIIAKEVGIDKVYSEVLPQDKNDIINSLKQNNKNLVAMVGDGVNDAIALTSADLGIAIGAGSDVAIDSSDIVLLKNDLMDVFNVINLSRRVLNTIKGNLFWAFFYNMIGVILATGLFYPYVKLNPMFGSLAMSFSSVFVVCNALTINLFKANKKKEVTKMQEIKIKVGGMMCMHCAKRVEDVCKSAENVINAIVDLNDKSVLITYENEIDLENIQKAIVLAGYELL